MNGAREQFVAVDESIVEAVQGVRTCARGRANSLARSLLGRVPGQASNPLFLLFAISSALSMRASAALLLSCITSEISQISSFFAR